MKSYFSIYADNFAVMRVDLSADEIMDMLSALADLCRWGECEYSPATAKQEYHWDKLLEKFDKDSVIYNRNQSNGKLGGRPPKEATNNPNDNPNETQMKTRITNNKEQITKKEKKGKEKKKVADAPSPPNDFFDDEGNGEDEAEQIPKDAKPCRFENSVFFIPLESPQKSPVPFSWAGDDMGFEWEEIVQQFAAFRDYWLSVSGSKGVKKDWLATWRNWLRRTKEWKADRKQA